MKGVGKYFKLTDNKYETVRVISVTAHSKVYLVRHTVLDVLRVAKVMRKSCPDYRRILKEAHLIKNFKHSGIPIIYDIYDCNDSICIIEEYISGKCLTEYIKMHDKLSERQIVEFGIQICNILEYLHTREDGSILYLDLKPDNIIISQEGNINIVDYDSSRTIESDDDSLKNYGTVGFASPEQYHIRKLNCSSDIYSLGMLLKYMTYNGDIQSMMNSLLYADNLIQKKLIPIINKCTRHNRKLRYKTAADVKKDLERILYKNEKNNKKIGNYHNIYVYGGKSNVGATHLCLCLASFLIKNNFKVVCIESEGKTDLRSEALKGSLCKDGTFYYNGISILPDYNETVRYNLDDFDFRIIDCGIYKEDKEQRSSERTWQEKYESDYMRIIVDVIGYTKDTVCRRIINESEDTYIFLNHISGKKFYEYAGLFGRKNVYRIPCVYDYKEQNEILNMSFEESLSDAFKDICMKADKGKYIQKERSIIEKIKGIFRKKAFSSKRVHQQK